MACRMNAKAYRAAIRPASMAAARVMWASLKSQLGATGGGSYKGMAVPFMGGSMESAVKHSPLD